MFEVRSVNPGELIRCSLITSPLNIVLKLDSSTSVDLCIEDLLNFELDFTVNLYRRGRRENSVRESIRSRGFEHRDVEHRVNSSHVNR